jgi:uncharacterized short protein YbdD (DUF466 family)
MLPSSRSRVEEVSALVVAAGSSRSARLAHNLARRTQRAWRAAARAARLAIGIPDYEVYVAHMRQHHPGAPPMDRGAFVLERMQARYGKGRARCC